MTKQLDLHGVRHQDVTRLVENFVLLNELPLRIITGNSSRMLSLVSEVLDEHDFKYVHFTQGQVIILK